MAGSLMGLDPSLGQMDWIIVHRWPNVAAMRAGAEVLPRKARQGIPAHGGRGAAQRKMGSGGGLGAEGVACWWNP